MSHAGPLAPQPPPRPPTRPRLATGLHTVAFSAAGIVLTGFATVVFWWAALIISWGPGTCGRAVPGRELWQARGSLFGASLALAAVPALFAADARRCSRSTVPWWVLTSLFLGVGVVGGLTLQPSTWCF